MKAQDFIVVDGAEGGTGAAPVEFTDHVGALRGPIDNLARVFKMYWPTANAHSVKANSAAMPCYCFVFVIEPNFALKWKWIRKTK